MVQRNLTTIPDVTNVVAPTGTGQLEAAIGEAGQGIIKAQQESVITKNFSQASLDINDQRSKMQLQYQNDPMAGIEAFKQQRQDILDSYGDQVSPFFKGQWNMGAKEIGLRDDMEMNSWAYAQARQNTQDNINTTMQNHFAQANQDGMDYGSGKTTDLTAIMNFAAGKAQLQAFGSANLGDKLTDKMMATYTPDATKSFLAGVAQTNPMKAAQLLDNPQFSSQLTLQERNQFGEMIEKTVKTNDMINALKQAQSTQQTTAMINDPSQTYYQKRLTLAQQEQQGAISQQTASNALRVLNAKNSVDAVTDSPKMGDLVQKMYDLNTMTGTSAKDYLIGATDIHNQILAAQADGSLNAADVQKMNNEMKTITSARMSGATEAISNTFPQAVKTQINTLPPEYRGDAVRNLFYATNGQSDKLSPDAYNQLVTTSAQKVVDDINAKRRQTAVQAMQPTAPVKPTQAVLSDDDFLKKVGASQQDVNNAAKQYNKTPEQVLEIMRKNYANQ